MTVRIFNGTSPIDAWPADARAIAYGDGLFETMRVHRGSVPWWDAHWERLVRGAQRLRLSLPGQAQVREEATALFDDAGDGVLKLLLGRGGTGRGYAPAANVAPIWMLSRHSLPTSLPHAKRAGLILRWCETRLALQPLLAGIKHCNRLEQVLARAECGDADVDEGLMLNHDGMVVSATAANVFVWRDGRWWTPPVDRCGVAGVCRSRLIPALDAIEAQLSKEDVEGAEAVFLCNAVRGILAVAQLGARAWPSHRAVDDARRELARIHPGFAFDLTP
jgi:4-amino-4-deoxychorismate lyase